MADQIEYRRGFRFKFGALPDAESANTELSRIRDKNGGQLTSRIVVDASQGKRAVFHNFIFELSDSEAIHRHRLDKAQLLLRSIVVIKEELPDKPVRQYEIATAYGREERPYVTMEEMLADPEKRAILLQRAMNELLAVQRKFHHLQELSIVFREVQTLRETLKT